MADAHKPPGSGCGYLPKTDVVATNAAVNSTTGAASASVTAAHAATAAANETRTETTSATVFRFMDLPTELRLQIYGHLVVVGKVFYTRDGQSIRNSVRFKDFRAYRKPQLSILRVSKAVHKEAESLYASENLFVLPVHFEFAIGPNTAYRIAFSERVMRKVRHVSVALCSTMSPWSSVSHIDDWDHMEAKNPGIFDRHTREQRLEHTHHISITRMLMSEVRMLNALYWMKKLRTIELDYTNAYCPMGCCRLITPDIITRWIGLWSCLQSIRVLGLRHEEEMHDFLKHWAAYVLVEGEGTSEETVIQGGKLFHIPSIEELRDINNITFGVDDDPWEDWKTTSATAANTKSQNMENNEPDSGSSGEVTNNHSVSEDHSAPIEDDDSDLEHHDKSDENGDGSDTDSYVTAKENIDP